MRIRCPHCHSPIEIVNDDPLSEVDCPSCGSRFSLLASQDTASWEAAPSRRIGQFELLEQVGIGHFGSVWKSRDTQLDRIVAVKIPRREQLDAAHLEQFFREARAAAQLRHPHIVPVYEVGQSDGVVYIVSDFITGCSLQQWLTGQRLTPHEAAELCFKVAAALHHAHESGVIHRDLKPGNIMLDLAGQPHLLDFGLARRETGEITMTVEGRILGTPAYMSPEQARGEAHRADAKSDVYSLGVVLFELLTGELPFRGDTRMLVVQILKDEPPSPRRLNGNVPRDLETICLKCLQKSPDRRYPSAAALAGDLQRWLDGRPIEARPVGRAERFVRWARREPRIAALAATILLVATLGFAAVTWQWRRAVAATTTANKNLAEKERQRERREVNFNRAMTAVDKMLTHVGAEDLAKVPGVAPVRKAVLEDAWKFYQELLEEKGADRELQFEMAQAAMRVGAIRARLDERDEALDAYSKAIAVLEPLHSVQPQDEKVAGVLYMCHMGSASMSGAKNDHLAALDSFGKAAAVVRVNARLQSNQWLVAKLHQETGRCLSALGKHVEAETAIRQSIAITEHEMELAARKPEMEGRFASFALDTAWRYRDLCGALLNQSPPRKAEYEQAALHSIDTFERIPQSTKFRQSSFDEWWGLNFVSAEQHSFRIENDLASFYEWHSAWLKGEGRAEEADRFLAKALDWRQKGIEDLQRQFASNSRQAIQGQLLARLNVNQARLFRKQKQTPEAASHYRRALDAYRQLAEDFPQNKFYAQGEVETASELAMLLVTDPQTRGDGYALFEQIRDAAQSLGKKAPTEQEVDYKIYQAIRDDLREKGAVVAAEPATRDALAIADRMAARGADDPLALEAVSFAYHCLGDLYWKERKQPVQAVEPYERAREAAERLMAQKGQLPWLDVELAWACLRSASAQFATRQDAHVVSVAVRGLEMWQLVVPRYPSVADFPLRLKASYELLARTLAHCPDPEPADLQKAVDLARAGTAADAENGLAWRALGIALCRQKAFEESLAPLEKAKSLNLPEPAYDSFFLALALAQTGKQAEAKTHFDGAARWVRNNRPDNPLFRALQEEVAPGLETAQDVDFKEFRSTFADYWATRQKSDWTAAEQKIRSALVVANRMAERDADDPLALEALGDAYHHLGDQYLLDRKQPAQAAEHYERARAARERLIAKQGLDRASAFGLGWTCQNGGTALLATKQDAHVVSVAIRGLEVREYLVAQDTANAGYRTLLQDSYTLLTRTLASCPDPQPDDLQKAIDLAGARTTTDAENGLAWRTLGIAFCRQQQFSDAAAALAKAKDLKLPEPAYELFFLAISFAKTDQAQAKQYLDEGAAWVKQNRPNNPLFRTLQAEAAAALENKHTN